MNHQHVASLNLFYEDGKLYVTVAGCSDVALVQKLGEQFDCKAERPVDTISSLVRRAEGIGKVVRQSIVNNMSDLIAHREKGKRPAQETEVIRVAALMIAEGKL